MFHAHFTLLLKTLTHSPQMKSAVSSAIFVIFFSILTGCSLIEKSSNERSPNATETKIRDVVYLKDGSVLRGTLRETDDTSKVKIVLADGSEFVRPKIEVERISTDTLVVTRYEPQKVKEKNLLESWYGYVGAGYAQPFYSGQTKREFDNFIRSENPRRLGIGLDYFGIYLPLQNERTLVGGIINSTTHGYGITEGNYFLTKTYMAVSAMHFLQNRIGDGFFVRGDLGFSSLSTDISGFSNLLPGEPVSISFPFIQDENGFAATLGAGYGFVVTPESRLLLKTTFNLQRFDGTNYYTLGISLGLLF